MQPSEHYLVITALGTDRPGIVNQITHYVSSCGCNIEDSRLALLGESFTFIMLISGSWNSIIKIESVLPTISIELDLLTVMKRTHAVKKAFMPTTLWIDVQVTDSPRIIERFTNLFNSSEYNIAELTSKTQIDENNNRVMLYIKMTIHTTYTQNIELIEERFNQICKELLAQGTLNIATNLQHRDKNGELS